MMQQNTSSWTKWQVLFGKEWLEMVRNYKLVWVPIVFILLGVMQPVTSYFLPEILASAGSLPEGAVIEIPLPSGAEVLSQTLQQYNTLGLLIVALSFMTAISSERSSGTAALMLVKPISRGAFVTSKWAAMAALILVSFALGYLGAWYYTILLIGPVESGLVFGSLLIYGLWLIFIGTLTLLFSALFKSGAPAAFAALGLAAALTIASSLWRDLLAWSPSLLAGRAYSLLQTAEVDAALWPSVCVTAAAIAGALAAASMLLKKRLSND
jgi:ABC-2 type transport system permease protein